MLAREVLLGRVVFLVLATTLISGCFTYGKVEPYKPNAFDPGASRSEISVAVVEVAQEGGSDYDGGTIGNGLLYQMPLVLYVTRQIKFFEPSIGKCLADDLTASRRFERVDYYADWTKLYQVYDTYDVVLSGTVHHDKRTERISLSGLSHAAFVLTFVGLPITYSTRDFSAEIYAISPEAPNKKVWADDVAFGSTRAASAWFAPAGWNECPTKSLQPVFREIQLELTQQAKSR